MPTGIGQIIANNPQLQEFAERCLSQVFDLCRYGDLMADDICEDMGITEDEMYWMFEQLGYSREEEQYEEMDECGIIERKIRGVPEIFTVCRN